MSFIENYWVVPGLPTANMVTVKKITTIVCEHYDMPWEKIISTRRFKDIRWIRHVMCFFIKHHLPKTTLKDIGAFVNRSHSNVINSLHRVNDLMETEESVRREIELINEKILFKV